MFFKRSSNEKYLEWLKENCPPVVITDNESESQYSKFASDFSLIVNVSNVRLNTVLALKKWT